MLLEIKCRKIVGGVARGSSLVTKQPINFLSMIDSINGIVYSRSHELYNSSIKGSVLFFPNAIGSSVGAYVLYSLKKNSAAPAAVVCTSKTDVTTASGCAISNIPLVDIVGFEFNTAPGLNSGLEAYLNADECIIEIMKTD